MRTPKEIKDEIAALKKLKPVGTFSQRTARSIKLCIQELEYPFDQTSEEWNELTHEQRDIIEQTGRWKEGESDEQPSKGWGALVK